MLSWIRSRGAPPVEKERFILHTDERSSGPRNASTAERMAHQTRRIQSRAVTPTGAPITQPVSQLSHEAQLLLDMVRVRETFGISQCCPSNRR